MTTLPSTGLDSREGARYKADEPPVPTVRLFADAPGVPLTYPYCEDDKIASLLLALDRLGAKARDKEVEDFMGQLVAKSLVTGAGVPSAPPAPPSPPLPPLFRPVAETVGGGHRLGSASDLTFREDWAKEDGKGGQGGVPGGGPRRSTGVATFAAFGLPRGGNWPRRTRAFHPKIAISKSGRKHVASKRKN